MVSFKNIVLGKTRNDKNVTLMFENCGGWNPDDHRDALETLKITWKVWGKLLVEKLNDEPIRAQIDRIVSAYDEAIGFHLKRATPLQEPREELGATG